MRDIDIRECLHRDELDKFHNDTDSLVVDELGLCQGEARVDVAVVNGAFHGYEIKSERDTLERLPSQKDVYNRSLDFITLVTSESHLKKARKVIPQFWGIIVAKKVEQHLVLKNVRKPKQNKKIDPFAIAQLLWKEEVLELLAEKGFVKGIKSKSRNVLWTLLVEATTIEELSSLVRVKLKSRQKWRLAH